MTTKELIVLLNSADPSGEFEVWVETYSYQSVQEPAQEVQVDPREFRYVTITSKKEKP